MRVERRADRAGEVDPLAAERERAALEARELEDAAGEAAQAHGLVSDDAEMLLVGRQHAVLHGLDGRLDRLKRRAQLVRDVGGQAALHLAIGLDRVGHLVKRLAEEPDLVIALHPGAGVAGRRRAAPRRSR